MNEQVIGKIETLKIEATDNLKNAYDSVQKIIELISSNSFNSDELINLHRISQNIIYYKNKL